MPASNTSKVIRRRLKRSSPHSPNSAPKGRIASPTRVALLLPALAAAVIVNVDGAFGLAVVGENPHETPVGIPEQDKETAFPNPFVGFTEICEVADWPESTVMLAGDKANVKLGGGMLMTYAADATALCEYPGTEAMASMVSLPCTSMNWPGLKLSDWPTTGVVPSSV